MKNKKLILLTIAAFIFATLLISCGHTKHEFGEWQAVKEATCTEDGLEVRVCECGEEESRSIDKVKHEYTAREEIVEPTCTEQGYTTRYCACGAKTTSHTDVIDHSFGAWTTYREATLFTKKAEKRSCNDCSAEETRETEFVTVKDTDKLLSFVNRYGEYLEGGKPNGNYDSSLDATLATPYGDRGVDFGQGGCYNGRYYYQAFVNVMDNGGVIAKVDTTTGEVVAYSEARNISHANDVTYNPNTNEVLAVYAGVIYVFDADTLAFKREFSVNIPDVKHEGITAMSYNAHNDTYVFYNGGQWLFYVVDGNFTKLISSGEMEPPYKTKPNSGRCASQGICSDENYIYSLFYEDVDGAGATLDYKAYVQVRDYEFNLINTFEVTLGKDFHEAENISVVDGKFYVGAASLYASGSKLRPFADFTVYEFNP